MVHRGPDRTATFVDGPLGLAHTRLSIQDPGPHGFSEVLHAFTSAAANSAYPRAWAYVFGAIVLGLVFYAATLALERLASRRR